MKLKTWVKNNGGALVVAKKLKVTPQVVRYWMNGKCTPRPKSLLNLVSLSKGQLSIQSLVKEITN
jgi:hypothetical protein